MSAPLTPPAAAQPSPAAAASSSITNNSQLTGSLPPALSKEELESQSRSSLPEGPKYLMEMFQNPPTIRNTYGWMSWLTPWTWGYRQPNYEAVLKGSGPLHETQSLDVADISKNSWIAKHPPEMSATSPAVPKISPHMPPALLWSIFGDAVGHGGGKVEFNEDAKWLSDVANASFSEHLFNPESFKAKLKLDKLIFSDDSVETFYTELALFRAANKERYPWVGEFIARAERELALLLVRADRCGDPVERTNGSSRRHFRDKLTGAIAAFLKEHPFTQVKELCENVGAKDYLEAINREIEDPAKRREVSQLIDNLHRMVLEHKDFSMKNLFQIEQQGFINKRPGCGSAMRAAPIGWCVAQQFDDPSKVSRQDFQKGLSLTAMLGLSLSRLTHQHAGACLASAMHAVTTYLLYFDFPLHDAQDIALEMFNVGTETGKMYFNYILDKTLSDPLKRQVLSPAIYCINWEDTYQRLCCGLEMRKSEIFDSADELLNYKGQIMSAQEAQEWDDAQKNRPFVQNGKLQNSVTRVKTDSGMSMNWPGNSADMILIASQCVHLALLEEPFMSAMRKELKIPEGKPAPAPSRIYPHVLRKVWNQLSEQDRRVIDERITRLACFTEGDKDSIGAQAKMFQGMLFGIDPRSQDFILAMS